MFAYQPAALGDILLAHKSFDVLRRALCRLLLGAEEAAWRCRRQHCPLPLPLPLATALGTS